MKKIFILLLALPFFANAQKKVGIGTTTPVQRLSIDSTLNIDQGNFDDGTKPSLRFGDGGTGEAIGSRRIAGGTNPFGLDFWTGNAKRMVISNAGNVGIGTTGPGYPLDVFDANNQGFFVNFTSNNASNSIIQIQNNAGGTNTANIGLGLYRNGSSKGYLYVNGNNNLIESTNGAEQIILTPAGNVGIGQSSPAYPLNFASSLGDKVALYGNGATSYGFGIQSNLLQIHTDGTNSDIAFGSGSSVSMIERMRIKGNGMVGIGVTNPIEQLHIYDTANTGYPLYVESNNATASYLAVNTRNNTANVGLAYYRGGSYKGENYLNTTNDYVIELAPVGSIFFGKSTNGFIGLGTNSPQQNLSVNAGMNIDQANLNTGTSTRALTFGSASGEGIGSRRTAGGNNSGLDFYTNFTNRLAITNAGNVGIGVISPGAKLQINAPGTWTNSENVDNALEIWNNAETLYMGADEVNNLSYIQAVGNGFVHTLALNPRTGNVAIGKSTATVPLDVAGNIKTSGDIQVQTDRGIVRNSGTEQLKFVVTGAALATTQAAFQTDATGVLFAQTFSAPPTVYVANILQNGANPLGDIDKVFITLYNVTTTGCSMKVHNAHNASITFNAVWQIVAIGPQ